ncbi:hypothetical protein C8Q76DRAFT_690230 [Earliella scabrosa]|nr:hypothetical protein C8Q76DRAFT_690230 [Earliella scabrosa]
MDIQASNQPDMIASFITVLQSSNLDALGQTRGFNNGEAIIYLLPPWYWCFVLQKWKLLVKRARASRRPARTSRTRQASPSKVAVDEDTGGLVSTGSGVRVYQSDTGCEADGDTVDQNGGNVIGCDSCNRVICSFHMPMAETLSPAEVVMLVYRCPSCHIRGDHKAKTHTPYFGWYRRVGETLVPFFEDWINIRGLNGRPQHARVDTSPVVIVHVRLASLEEAGTPARLAYGALQAYFTGPHASRLVYIDAPYNISCVEDSEKYKASLTDALGVLDRFTAARVLFFIYTHAETSSGDLFYDDSTSAASADQWWDDVIPHKLQEAGKDHNVTLVMLCCGAMLAFRDKFAAHAALGAPFFVAFVHRVYIEGVPLDEAHLGDLLGSSLYLARHTPVIVLTRSSAERTAREDVVSLTVTQYLWSHPTIRPWGSALPLQCPTCGGLSSFKCTQGPGGATVSTCLVPGCMYKRTYEKPATVNFLKGGEGGRWMTRLLNP